MAQGVPDAYRVHIYEQADSVAPRSAYASVRQDSVSQVRVVLR